MCSSSVGQPCPQPSLCFRLAESPEEMEVSLLDGAEREEAAAAAVPCHAPSSCPSGPRRCEPSAGHALLVSARRGGDSQWLRHHVLTHPLSGCQPLQYSTTVRGNLPGTGCAKNKTAVFAAELALGPSFLSVYS